MLLVKQSQGLRFRNHCTKTACKANKLLGIVRHTLKPCTKSVKARAYECLVRPKLEYASAARNPYTDEDVNRLEQVQKNAARFVCGDYRRTTHSSDLVHHLGWDTLEHRRLLHQASMFYKIRNGLVRIEFPKCVTPSLRETKPHNYQQLKSNILSYSYSFFPRTIRVWNRLTRPVHEALSVTTFEALAKPIIMSMNPPAYLRRL